MKANTLDIRPLSGAIGAEILGVDLAQDVSDSTVAAIRAAWLEHCVVFFRGQTLTPEEFLRVAGSFGEPIEYPFVKGLDGFPQITPVIKLEHEKINFGGLWHSDTAYLERPPMATMLIARETPPRGGDTLFANMYLAYETLSEGMKRVLDGLVTVNSSAKADVTRTREDRIKDSGKTRGEEGIRRRASGGAHAPRDRPQGALRQWRAHGALQGHDRRGKRAAADYLFQHAMRPEFTCRFRWEPGSIALWDNRCTQHNPVNDYHGYRRVMHRVTLAGDAPR